MAGSETTVCIKVVDNDKMDAHEPSSKASALLLSFTRRLVRKLE